MNEADKSEQILASLKPEAADRLRRMLQTGEIRLTQVFYDPATPKDTRKQIEHEFNTTVQPAFLRHLAATARGELQRIGIDEHGIACMEVGMLPHTEQGLPYPLNIDHIQERAGSGERSELANDFSNLVLIYRPLHLLKSRFVNAQTRNLEQETEIYTLTPANVPEPTQQILVPSGVDMSPENPGRAVWLYRAQAAAERFEHIANISHSRTNDGTVILELNQARTACERIWEWTAAAHRKADPEGFNALLDGIPGATPDPETVSFFNAWLNTLPEEKPGPNAPQPRIALGLDRHDIRSLETLSGFALLNYGNFDPVAIMVPHEALSRIHATLRSVPENEAASLTYAEIGQLLHVVGMVKDIKPYVNDDLLPLNVAQIERLEDSLYAVPRPGQALTTPPAIRMR